MYLIPFTKFIQHHKFVEDCGLCTNIESVYGEYVYELFNNMLMDKGYSEAYPIGENSLLEPHQVSIGRAMYRRNRVMNTLYKGNQYKLRRKLYAEFVQFMKGVEL